VFEFKDIEGTLVGFRFPDYMSEINMAGWHFHFISRNGLAGGHVVGCVAYNGTIGIDEASNFCLKLSRMDSFRDAALHKPDKQVLEKIEK
jgi:acetolactate decarboxylase